MKEDILIEKIKRKKQFRTELLEQRRKEREYADEDKQRRLIDDKAEALKTLTEVSALLGGFTFSAMVEVKIPNSIEDTFLIIYATACALSVVILMVSCMYASYILLAIYKWNATNCETFIQFWDIFCERDFKFGFRMFNAGIISLIVVLIMIPWAMVDNHPDRVMVSCIEGAIFIVMAIYLYTQIVPKWLGFLSKGSTVFRLVPPTAYQQSPQQQQPEPQQPNFDVFDERREQLVPARSS